MKVEVKRLPKSEIELKITIPVQDFDKSRERAILDLGKELEVKGFRKGKIPKEVVEKTLGEEKILRTAAEASIKENYIKAITENKIEPLGQPKIEILKFAPGNPFEFKAKVSVMPEVKLPDYKKIARSCQKKEVSVSEKEIEDALNWLQKSRAKYVAKIEPAQKGDFIEIEFSSPQIESGSKKQDAFILGEGHLISGFEEKLVGLKAGEEQNFSLTLPQNFPTPELKGKEVDFKVKVKTVQRIELPEITDEWAKTLGKFENLKTLKDNIREGFLLEKKQAESQRVRQEILEKIAQATEIEIPEVLINQEKNRMLANLKKGVTQNLQISFQDYLQQIKKTEQEFEAFLLPEAQKRVKNSLILREISKKEHIKADEEEIKEEVNKILKQYSDPKKAEEELDLEKLKVYVEGVIEDEKVFQILESLAGK